MPPVQSGRTSLTKNFNLDTLVTAVASLNPGVDSAFEVADKLDQAVSGGGAAYRDLWNDLFIYTPRISPTLDPTTPQAKSHILDDSELLEACRSGRADRFLVAWCALLFADENREFIVRELLTDADGHLDPAKIGRTPTEQELVRAFNTPSTATATSLGLPLLTQPAPPGTSTDRSKETTNLLRLMVAAQLFVPDEKGASILGVDKFLPTAFAVPAAIKLAATYIAERGIFAANDEQWIDLTLGIGMNRWLNLSPEEFRAAAYGLTVRTHKPRPTLATVPPELAELRMLLERSGQVVLQGPPGSGKTHTAKAYIDWVTAGHRKKSRLQHIIANLPAHERTAERIADEVEYEGITALWEITQFHPEVRYPNFVRTLAAEPTAGGVTFKPQHRLLSLMAAVAVELEARSVDVDVVMIVDEINRGSLDGIFGELLYALEYRGEPVTTPLAVDGDPSLTIPESMHFIGAMNNADRSLALLDYALRRRFSFLDVEATDAPIKSATYADADAQAAAGWLFDKTNELLASAQVGLKIGASYLLPKGGNDTATIASRYVYEVLPLLFEYELEQEVSSDDLNEFLKRLGISRDDAQPARSAALVKGLQLTPWAVATTPPSDAALGSGDSGAVGTETPSEPGTGADVSEETTGSDGGSIQHGETVELPSETPGQS